MLSPTHHHPHDQLGACICSWYSTLLRWRRHVLFSSLTSLYPKTNWSRVVDYAFRSLKRQLILISHILVQLGSLRSRPEYDPLDFRWSNKQPEERSGESPWISFVSLGMGGVFGRKVMDYLTTVWILLMSTTPIKYHVVCVYNWNGVTVNKTTTCLKQAETHKPNSRICLFAPKTDVSVSLVKTSN